MDGQAAEHKRNLSDQEQFESSKIICLNKIKKNKCEECQYETPSIRNLKRHIKAVHDKIRNFVCDICGYAASQKVHLKQHNDAVHKMTESTYKCGKCSYKSNLKRDVKKHIQFVHGKIRNHVCDECDYATSDKSVLSCHKAAVHKTGDREFRCELCPHKSYWKHSLQRHVRNIHM